MSGMDIDSTTTGDAAHHRQGADLASHDAAILDCYRKASTLIQRGAISDGLLGAMLDGLEEMVAQRTQVHTIVANPFANMALSSRIKPRQLTIDAPSLMIACGLAMRRFDPS